jgi:branched-chain amino acid aminotransferase
MFENRIAYLDGAFVAGGEAKIPIMSHSMGRGSAIFDVLSFSETPGGRAVFRLDEHVARFLRSAAALDMKSPLSDGQIKEAVLETVRRNQLPRGAIKIVGFFSDPSFFILPPDEPFHFAVFVFDSEEDFGDRALGKDESVSAFVSRWRRLDPQTVPIEAKVAANYLNGIVARTDAKKNGCDYAIMLDSEGNIAEGGTESIFLVSRGRLLTPNIGHILQGITRKSILPVAAALGIETIAGPQPEALLYEADEVFFAGTVHRVVPVGRINDRVLPAAPGPVTRKIAAQVEEITAGHDERFSTWLFPV